MHGLKASSVSRRITLSYLILALCSLSPLHAWAGVANSSALSDPAGVGKPAHADDPTQTDLSIRFHIHGYYRMRWSMLNNLDLDRGPTPSSKKTLYPQPASGDVPINSADMRLRVDLSLEIARSVRVVVRVDALDNIVLGSTPRGFPRTGQIPSIVATTGQNPPIAGRNALTDSLQLKRAYGEVILPFGYLAAGRMGALTPWGLGIVVHSGDDLDADIGDHGDRVVLALALFGHILTAAYDWSASGPVASVPGGSQIDLDPGDNVRSYALAFARYDTPSAVSRKLRGGARVINYGLLFSFREQSLDVPEYYTRYKDVASVKKGDLVQRDAWSFLLSAWFMFRSAWLRIELEAAYGQGAIGNSSLIPGVRLTKPITSQQFAGVLQMALAPPRGRWGLGVELGVASGDDAPGFGVSGELNQSRTQKGDLDGPQIRYPQDTTVNNFRFHSNYRIDQIFWRRIVGQITDALYLKGAAHFDVTSRMRLWSSVLYSRAMMDSTPPGGDANLGVEWDVGVRYNYDPGFEIRFTVGMFFPFAGLRNIALQREPTPAFASHLVLGYVF